MEIRNEIKSAVAKSLVESSTANKSYVRVQPTGDVTITEETSWVCSADEYYKQVPHTLSLEIPKWTRDYSGLSENEVETCVDNRFDVAQELVDDWARTIEAWIEAGNLIVTV